jgi:hypothetical protein
LNHLAPSPPDCRFTIVCEDVRREDNGKLLIIGAFAPDIVIASIPSVLKQLVFLQLFDWKEKGQFSLRGRLDCISHSGVSQVASGLLVVEVPKPGPGVTGFLFNSLKIEQTGEYIFRTSFEGHQDNLFFEYKFNVGIGQTIKNP